MRTSLTSCKNPYGLSVAFFSSFLSCSRCSAAVRNENESDVWVEALGLILAFPFDFNFLEIGSSSSSSTSSESNDWRDEGREEEVFMDPTSASESSDGTTKSSSSSEALEDFRPVFAGDFLNLVILCVNELETSESSSSSSGVSSEYRAFFRRPGGECWVIVIRCKTNTHFFFQKVMMVARTMNALSLKTVQTLEYPHPNHLQRAFV